jgi:hypothetical protein
MTEAPQDLTFEQLVDELEATIARMAGALVEVGDLLDAEVSARIEKLTAPTD